MTVWAKDFTDRADCGHGSRHLRPTLWVDKFGETQAMVDWQDRAPYKLPDGRLKYRHHHVWEMRERRPCRLCGNLSFLSDCQLRPCHKACADIEFLRTHEALERRISGHG